MELSPWKLKFMPGWNRHFEKFDKSIQQQILKKLDQMKQPLSSRELHGSRYQVEEVDQYRISFIQNDNSKTKNIHFVGDHKQYEK